MKTAVGSSSSYSSLSVCVGIGSSLAILAWGDARISETARNLLLDAKVSSNIQSLDRGLRGGPDHMLFDLQQGAFATSSQWHEYGVGFQAELGIVGEENPVWWMADWPEPVQINLVALSGTYDNQPQPTTAWKIEFRHDGRWTTHARGVGGWYDRGYYIWGGPGTEPITLDAFRVSVFSRDDQTPIQSVHFRGEPGKSWIAAYCPPIAARIVAPDTPIRATQPAEFSAVPLLGEIQSWSWDFGDEERVAGRTVRHMFTRTGQVEVGLQFSDGEHTDRIRRTVTVLPPVEARIVPLTKAVMAGEPVAFSAAASFGSIREYQWDFGDSVQASGRETKHVFAEPGIYQVVLTVTDGTYADTCPALVRVHTEQTVRLPQLLLDTDAKNEQDDQHYIGYALFSELDILGINSVHHGGGQEPINYAEIRHIIELSRQSGLPEDRVPLVFRGADQRLAVPDSGRWDDTEPIVTAGSEAILAAARGASLDNPVWIVPVGPGTNPASAILQARREGFELKDRIRILWLGGSNNEIINEFNGNNDPWSMYVVCHSGIETWIMPAPVGARVAIDKRTEGHLYADHPLGQYLTSIMPASNKALYDASCLSAIISDHLGLGWVKKTEPVVVAGPENGYRWTRTGQPTPVQVIREIDQQAMQRDLFESMKGRPTRLLGPVRIIFDTDMGSDCDDAGALAVLHAYADRGLAEIIGCIYSSGKVPYGAGIVEAINIYYGRPEIPIGAAHDDAVGDPIDKMTAEKLAKDTAAFGHTIIHSRDAEEMTALNRRLLAREQDQSVVYLTVGHTKGFHDLLVSEPDDISSLSGRELVATKVKRWVAMGALGANNKDGHYRKEWNFHSNGSAPYTKHLVENCPVPIVYIAAGSDVFTGKSLKATPPGNIVRTVYRDWLWNVEKKTLADQRPSWDLIAVRYAVLGPGEYLVAEEDGWLEFDVDKGARWIQGERRNPQTFVTLKPGLGQELADDLNAWLAAEPKHQQ